MPATLYLRPSPRAFFLLTPTHALVFRLPAPHETKAARSVVVAEFIPASNVDVHGLIPLSSQDGVVGVLGVTSVPTARSPVPEVFLLLATVATPLNPLLPYTSYRPVRLVSVEFHSLTSSYWDPPTLNDPTVDELDNPYAMHAINSATSGSNYPSTTLSEAERNSARTEHPCAGMKKYLESGGFFFAQQGDWDFSTRLGETNWTHATGQSAQATNPLDTYDDRFVWNATLLAPLLGFRQNLDTVDRTSLDTLALLIPVIQGFCGSTTIPTGEWTDDSHPNVASFGIISRLSWKRAGARFRTRGIDDDGQVANFVETEVLFATSSVCMSYVLVRGSVPLFWQQPSQGIQTLQQKVEITRPPQATQPAFDKHFLELLEHYHAVHAINLLGHRDAEAMLSAAYTDHLKFLCSNLEATPSSEKSDFAATRNTLSLTPYDFHAAIKAEGHEAVKMDFSSRLREVAESIDRFEWTVIEAPTGQIVTRQQGVFRVNCLDCLDRTNYAQEVLSSIILWKMLQSIDSPLTSSASIWSAHRELWADNGDRLSRIYAGTGAINTSTTRTGKKTFAGMLSDATKSATRAYVNNFQDKAKQEAIDMLLGMMAGQRPVILFDPLGDSVHAELRERVNEYSEPRHVVVFAGTWNLNGKPPNESLDPWLFPQDTPEADIYAIAFQEIVELSPQQILQTDPAKKRKWEAFIMEAFAERKGKGEYLLYRSEQLVGTALIIVMRSSLVNAVRSVESATKKTGLSGLSGNKGGVGIRLHLFDSTICFMTCHLAAGQNNVNDRNSDYHTISSGLKFLKGKTIDDHDIVIWAADFNYRINLSNEIVRNRAEGRNFDELLGSDQLLQAVDRGDVFTGYEEGPITFPPTYKYDNGSDQYDSSEKARIPAWTDRVLFKGTQLRLKEYSRATLRTSDHRPVHAVFDATVREVDQVKKAAIRLEIVKAMQKDRGNVMALGGRTTSERVQAMARDFHKSLNTSSPPRNESPSSVVANGRAFWQAASSQTGRPAGTAGSPTAQPKIPPRPPTLPARPGSGSSPGSMPALQAPLIPQQARPAPPPPPARSASGSTSANSTAARSGVDSSLPRVNSRSALTPMATGDFVVVAHPITSGVPGSNPNMAVGATRAPAPLVPSRGTQATKPSGKTGSTPALPPRPTPAPASQSPTTATTSTAPIPPKVGPKPTPPKPKPKPSLDLNSSPPMGLESPVQPDPIKLPTSPSPATAASPALATSPVDKKSARPPMPAKPASLRGKAVGTGDAGGSSEA